MEGRVIPFLAASDATHAEGMAPTAGPVTGQLMGYPVDSCSCVVGNPGATHENPRGQWLATY